MLTLPGFSGTNSSLLLDIVLKIFIVFLTLQVFLNVFMNAGDGFVMSGHA